MFQDETELRRLWSRPDTRQTLLEGCLYLEQNEASYGKVLEPRKTLFERRGGHPKHLLEDAPDDLSLRENRKKRIANHIKNRHQKSN